MNETMWSRTIDNRHGVIAHWIRSGILLVATMSVVGAATAQTQLPVNQVGLPSNGTFSGGSIDSVQLNNGNLHVDIPLLHLPGIGMDTDIHFVYDNKVWTFQNNQPAGAAAWTYVYPTRGLWSLEDPLSGGITETSSILNWTCNNPNGISTNEQFEYVNSISYTDGDGTNHPFPSLMGTPSSVSVQCENVPDQLSSTGYSGDSAGYLATTNSSGNVASIIDKHGRKYIFGQNSLISGASLFPSYFPKQVEDSNGNRITGTGSGFIDTVNRTITETNNATSTAIKYTDQNGSPQTITINYVSVPINYPAICEGDGQPVAACSQTNGPGYTASVGTMQLPGSFVLQNGDTYTIQYNNNGFGEISSITLPTGAAISYTYGNWDGSGEQVLSRMVTSNGMSSTWDFGYTPFVQLTQAALAEATTTTVTDPTSNDTAYTCTAYPLANGTFWTGQGGGLPPCQMTAENIYTGRAASGALLATKTTGYAISGVILPTSETFTWNATGQTSETDTQWDAGTNNMGAMNVSFGNVVSKQAYDFGSGVHGSLLSNTLYSYLYNQQSAYYTANMLDRVNQVSVYNSTTPSSSSLVAQTTTAFDSFNQSSINGQGALVGTSGTTQHDYSGYGPGITLRGLPTSVAKYTGPNSSAITTYVNYNDLGQLTVSTDGMGYYTTYTYGSQNAFVSSITSPKTTNNIAHVVSPTYNVNTGLLTSQTDFNKNTTTYTYDSRMRPLTVTRPDGGSTTTSYPSANLIQTSVTEDSSRTEVTTTDLDGLGRPVSVSSTSDATCGLLSVDTTYDLMGRKSSVSNPHCSSSQVTDGWTTYSYDAVGRIISKQNPDGSSQTWSFNGSTIDSYDETGRHWRRTYDAAGRLTKVLEPDGSTNIGNVPSLETDYSYDTLGDLLRVDQWGGTNPSSTDHVRQFAYDAVSRLLAANNPENSSALYPASQTCTGTTGTWTACYIYDLNSNLSSKTDNRGIKTTYSYDAMNRLLSKTYTDSTPPEAFTYDTGGTNTTGQLTSAVAGSGTTTAQRKMTSYDKVGRLLGEQQCTPANCAGTAYALSYQYDWTGAMIQSTNSVGQNGSALQLNNKYDVAGRLITVSSSWGSSGTDTYHPPTLFAASTNSSNIGYGPMGLQNAALGVNLPRGTTTGTLFRAYDNRGRAVFEGDSGNGSISTTDSTGSITISGAEQQLTRVNAPGTATFIITGTEGTHNGNCIQYWPYPSTSCETYQIVPDSGAVKVNVATPSGTITAVGSFGAGDTTASVAQSLAGSFQSFGFPATVSGNVVTVQANVTGSSGDYSFTIDDESSNFYGDFYVYGPNNSLSGSFANGTTGATYYDQGAITVTLSGTPVSVYFGPCTTPAGLASSLASAINATAGGFVSAAASGQTISLQSTNGGTYADWSVSSSVTFDTTNFTSPSYTVSTSGNMSGGSDSSANLVYSFMIPDAGGFDRNGNLLSVTDSVMGQWNYSYDNLNRLLTGSAGSGSYANLSSSSWSYDAFGNRTSEATPAANSTASFTSLSNQITGSSAGSFAYDAAGNVIYDGLNQYIYDAEGRLCAVSQYAGGYVGYFYDADGTRVAKGSLSQFSCNFASNGFIPTTSWVLGPGGEQITELAISGSPGSYVSSWKHTNVFGSLGLMATYAWSNTANQSSTYFALNDWLGTKRAEVGAEGCVSTFASLPYGSGLGGSGNCPDATEHHFTGKERDTESGNDYFGARYYGSSMGRFMTPDPSTLEYADPENPQSLNLYAYVQNNPLVNVDPDGLDCVYTSNLTSTSVSVTTVRGDCINAGGKDDNGVFVDGTINADSYKAGVDKNGDVELTFGVQTEDAGSSGTGDNATIKSSGNAGMIDIGKAVNPDTEISPWAMSFIQQTNQDNQHKIGCIAQAYGVGGAGLAAHQSGQPYFAKPFAAPGAAADTSAFSKALGGLGKMPFRVPTPMGGPGTGVPFRWAKTANLGRAAGRYAPAVGIATTAYAAYQLGNCY